MDNVIKARMKDGIHTKDVTKIHTRNDTKNYTKDVTKVRTKDTAKVHMKGEVIKLVLPTRQHREQVEEFKEKMMQGDGKMDGCGTLKNKDFDTWLQECDDWREGRNLPDGYAPSTQYLAIRESDNKLIGLIQLRHKMTPRLVEYGGHIGYCVAPDERRKGYATKMLGICLSECKKLGIARVFVDCFKDNVGSSKVIMNNGAVLEKEVLCEGKPFLKFVIELP